MFPLACLLSNGSMYVVVYSTTRKKYIFSSSACAFLTFGHFNFQLRDFDQNESMR